MAEETNKRMSQLIVFRQITLVETGFNLTEHVDRICAKLESAGYYDDCRLHFFTACIWCC